jgi:SH3 domain protein
MATMSRFWKISVLATLGLSLIAQTSWASKAFVTDSFRISLRRGPSIENKILRFIPSGLPVEVYETQEGWSRVRVLEEDEGVLEGWILSRYLVRRLPWEDQAKTLKEENVRLKEKLATINEKWEAKIRHQQGFSEQLKNNYEIARKTASELTEENEILKSSKRNKWFTAGGLVLFSGLVVGLFLGKQPRKRRLSF